MKLKHSLFATCACITLAAGVAAAGPGGLNLGWDDCGGLPASVDKAFACNTNSGPAFTLVASFVAPSFVTAMTANAAAIDIQSASAAFPNWWNLRVTCRSGALTGNFDFTGGPFTCHDYWQGGAIGGVHQFQPPVGNRERIVAAFALPTGDPRIRGIAEGTEVYSFKVNISRFRSAGLTICPGCEVGVCIVLNSITLQQTPDTPAGNKFVSAVANRNHVAWQGGIGVDCYTTTPARNATWGSIKALYR